MTIISLFFVFSFSAGEFYCYGRGVAVSKREIHSGCFFFPCFLEKRGIFLFKPEFFGKIGLYRNGDCKK